jgi:diguanylate cyclase (GGDEF)-like protein
MIANTLKRLRFNTTAMPGCGNSDALGSVQEDQSREIDRLLEGGFRGGKFPEGLQARYKEEHVTQRQKGLAIRGLLSIVLFNIFLLPDLFMVPDVFDLALKMRLLVFTTGTILGVYLIMRLQSGYAREWVTTGVGLAAAAVNLHICLSSKDEFAGPYLVSMLPIILFSNAVAQMRFFPALVMDVAILLMFGFGVWMLANPDNLPMLLSAALTLASASVFTLYSCYTLERDERQNWLLRLREKVTMHELERANRHLDQVSRMDILTEVANRRHFDEYLQLAWERARHDGSEISLMMIDVDHFKSYNDRYGQPTGDDCLKDVAATLKRRLREPGDLIARFGGEEFIAVLVDTPLVAATIAAERARKGVENLNRSHAASPTHESVTVSIGVACLRPNSPHASPPQLIAAADEALYQAKSHGRNRIFAFATAD